MLFSPHLPTYLHLCLYPLLSHLSMNELLVLLAKEISSCAINPMPSCLVTIINLVIIPPIVYIN